MSELTINVKINDQEVSQDQVQQLELKRYYIAAKLLLDRLQENQSLSNQLSSQINKVQTLLKQKDATLKDFKAAMINLKLAIGDDNMRPLLKPDTDYMSTQYTDKVSHQKGNYNLSNTVVTVKGMTLDQFLGWFGGRKAANDRKQMLLANPEHYLVTTKQVNGSAGQELIETMGLFERPMHYYLHFTDDPNNYPAPRLAGYPKYMCVVGSDVRTGQDAGIVAMHQFKPEEDGFTANLNIYFDKNYPVALANGHTKHLAIEFSNWIRAAYQTL